MFHVSYLISFVGFFLLIINFQLNFIIVKKKKVKLLKSITLALFFLFLNCIIAMLKVFLNLTYKKHRLKHFVSLMADSSSNITCAQFCNNINVKKKIIIIKNQIRNNYF